METKVERISPEMAMDILKKDGVVVNPEEVMIILEFLYQMAEIAVDQYLAKRAEQINTK